MFKENTEPSQNINTVQDLDSRTFSEKLKNDNNGILIDVRTKMEYNSGHIPNSTLIDISSPDFMNKIDELDRDKNYYLYCRSGNRSYHAGRQMLAMGFKTVYNLESGILDWDEDLE